MLAKVELLLGPLARALSHPERIGLLLTHPLTQIKETLGQV